MTYRVAAFWMILTAITGWVLFETSAKVDETRKNLAETRSEILFEQQNLRVLQAEWSYLNQPARLERLVKQYLADMQPAKAAQIVSLADIPQRPAQEPAPLLAAATLLTEQEQEQEQSQTPEVPDSFSETEVRLSYPLPLQKPKNMQVPGLAAQKKTDASRLQAKTGAPDRKEAPRTAGKSRNSPQTRDFSSVLGALGVEGGDKTRGMP